jgi:hypothetical protein
VEADLSRYHQCGLADLDSGDLQWWQLHAYITHLPPDSATATATGGDGWTVGDYLIADIWQSLTGQSHPADPRARRERERRAAEARETKARHDQLNRDKRSVFRRRQPSE